MDILKIGFGFLIGVLLTSLFFITPTAAGQNDTLLNYTETILLNAKNKALTIENTILQNKISDFEQQTCSGDFISSSNHDNIGTYHCFEQNGRYECNLKFNGAISMTKPAYGTSMYPCLSPGDELILADFVEPVVGDFVYAKLGFDYGVHQIVKIENGRYTLKGVNNKLSDPFLVYRNDIGGVVVGRFVGFEN